MRTKRTFQEPCGCTYRVENDREEWVHLCGEHKLEHDDLHRRAAQEHRPQRQTPEAA
jgi:hypothetical protein